MICVDGIRTVPNNAGTGSHCWWNCWCWKICDGRQEEFCRGAEEAACLYELSLEGFCSIKLCIILNDPNPENDYETRAFQWNVQPLFIIARKLFMTTTITNQLEYPGKNTENTEFWNRSQSHKILWEKWISKQKKMKRKEERENWK